MLLYASTTMTLLSRNSILSLFYPRKYGSRICMGTNGNIWARNSVSNTSNEENVSVEKPTKVKGKSKKPTSRKSFGTSVIEPTLEFERRENIHSVVGIHLGPKSLYWAKVDRQRNILDWNSADLFPTPDGGRKMNLPKLFAMLDTLSESIPFSDIFVLETPHQRALSSVSSPAVIATTILRSQVLAMLLTILNLRLENEDATEEYYHKVFLLKQRTVSRFFNLLVGTERVSALALVNLILGIKSSSRAVNVSEIMDENGMENDESISKDTPGKSAITPAHAASWIIDSYCALGPVERESMSQALLSALAFYDLVVLKNPKDVAPS